MSTYTFLSLVHLRERTWETAGRSRLVGGNTKLIEMICPGKTDDQ